MYTLICRIVHKLHKWPKSVLLISAVITLIALYFAIQLKIKTSIIDVLPGNLQSIHLLNKVEEKFGGLGKLTLIIASGDSSLNREAVEYLAEYLRHHPDINFLDYKNEIEFYEKNKLLYIKYADLKNIKERINHQIEQAKNKNNPLLVEYDNFADPLPEPATTLDFQDLEKKYLKNLKPYHGTLDEKALIFHIYPNFDVADIKKCKRLENEVKFSINRFGKIENLDVYYTGEVMQTIKEEGRLLNEVFGSGWVSLLTVFGILMLFYFRIPLGPLLALIPLAMGIIWTLALANLLIGHLSLVTLSLAIILLGLGFDAALHLLARYIEERQKNLSAEVAFETITLETGPAITTGALTTAAAFFSITITDFKGFYEFGIIAGWGMICTLTTIILVFPTLLIILERNSLIHVLKKHTSHQVQYTPRPFLQWKRNAFLIGFLTLVFLSTGLQTQFEYNFEKLQFPRFNAKADSILHVAGEVLRSPTVIISPSQEEAQRITWSVNQHIEKDTLTPTIHSVVSLNDLLPKNQEKKLMLIKEIKDLVSPQVIAKSDSLIKISLLKLQESWDVTSLTTKDLPESFQKKFIGKDNQPGNFTFIFPSIDLNNGLNCKAFADDTRQIWVDDSTYYPTSGIAVVYSDLLNLMIPDTIKALFIALFTVFLLVLINTKSFRSTIIIFCPLLLGIVWTLGIMKLTGLKINHFNLVVLPAMIGIGIDNSIHLYHRYLEEGVGSLYFVTKKTGMVIVTTSLTSLAGFYGLVFSEHLGLFSMGITAMIGITSTLVASILFVPLFIGLLDLKKINQSQSYPHL